MRRLPARTTQSELMIQPIVCPTCAGEPHPTIADTIAAIERRTR